MIKPYSNFVNKNRTSEVSTWYNFNNYEEFKNEFFRVSEIVKKTFPLYMGLKGNDRFTKKGMKLEDYYYFNYMTNRRLCKYGIEVFHKEVSECNYFKKNIRL